MPLQHATRRPAARRSHRPPRGRSILCGEVFEVVRGVLGDCFDCVGMNGSTDERRLGIAIDSAKINNLSEY